MREEDEEEDKKNIGMAPKLGDCVAPATQVGYSWSKVGVKFLLHAPSVLYRYEPSSATMNSNCYKVLVFFLFFFSSAVLFKFKRQYEEVRSIYYTIFVVSSLLLMAIWKSFIMTWSLTKKKINLISFKLYYYFKQ